MMEYKVVVARDVASGVDDLQRYLNAQVEDGWTVVTADEGVIYLARLNRAADVAPDDIRRRVAR